MSTIFLHCCPNAAQIMKCSCKLVASTNSCDEKIVYTICGAIIWVSAIIVGGSLIWRLLHHISIGCQERRKNKKDVEDCKRKQEADLIDKLLDFLKNKATEKSNNSQQPKSGNKVSLEANEIYDLLDNNAAKSYSEDLRKQYISLCVKLLRDAKNSETNTSNESANINQPYYADMYIRILCYLIEKTQHGKLNQKDLDLLKCFGIENKKPEQS